MSKTIHQMMPMVQRAKPNPEHLSLIQLGVKTWNEWRRKNPKEVPDFSNASFARMDLSGANLENAKLLGANFENTKLDKATFANASFGGAKFNRATAQGSEFRGASFSMADIRDTNLKLAKFFGAKFYSTGFYSVDLEGADFSRAQFDACFMESNFRGVNFTNAKITHSQICGADFSHARMGNSVIADTDICDVKGLDSVIHEAPSSIGSDTICFSTGNIPDTFLRGAGVPEQLVTYLPSLRGAMEPIQWHSCFISYSTQNDEFAQRLHSRMRQAGLRVWFAPEDMKGGDYFFEQIERAIQLHDRLLLVLSEDSIRSKWVEREIRKARKVERAEKRRKLFPITLTDYATLKKWECLDSDTGEDLAEEVRKYHIPDFSNWKNHAAFERAFARLEKDLRLSIA